MNKDEYDFYMQELQKYGGNVNIIILTSADEKKTLNIHNRLFFEAIKELDARLKALENK